MNLVPESDGEYSLGIGNLILLEQQLNSDAGQETYAKKQETYYKKSNYTWIKVFCDKHSVWDHTMINERAVDMAKLYYSKILGKQVPEDYA